MKKTTLAVLLLCTAAILLTGCRLPADEPRPVSAVHVAAADVPTAAPTDIPTKIPIGITTAEATAEPTASPGEPPADANDFDDAASDAVELTLTEPVDDLALLIGSYKALETITLWDGAPRRAVQAALAAKDGLRVLWTDAEFGASDSTAAHLCFDSTGADVSGLLAYLSCFPALSEVDLTAAPLSLEDGDLLQATYPAVTFVRSVPLNGKQYVSTVESLKLESANIKDPVQFTEDLNRFQKLSYLDMTFCTLSNEELAALRDRYPEKGIVWTVKLRGRWIRTDTVAYTSNQRADNTSRITSINCEVLRYCNKLIALDLGHNAITDLEWIRSLPQLQLLILADNKITDISPLADLKKLKYIELFMNDITDISAFGEMPDLLDVNICFTDVEDLTPLYSCKKLERIWIARSNYTEEGLAALKEAFPDAVFFADPNARGSTGSGWRTHPRYDTYLRMFKENTALDPFVP